MILGYRQVHDRKFNGCGSGGRGPSQRAGNRPKFAKISCTRIFEHTCAYARWALMHCFLSVCPSVCLVSLDQNFVT